jgi:hypothetical protein
MANVKQIFDYIQGMNPTTNTINSFGTYVSNQNQQVADMVTSEVVKALDQNTLAYKIVSSSSRFSDKQLWVVAYELVKNEEFSQMVADFYAEIERKENFKKASSAKKLADNKANSQSVLDYVKEQGRLLKDYYAFVKGSKEYKKEFFSKKFTMESANAFLAQ